MNDHSPENEHPPIDAGTAEPDGDCTVPREADPDAPVQIDAERIRDLLLSDKAYIEKIARTKYLMAYPNEQVFRYRGR